MYTADATAATCSSLFTSHPSLEIYHFDFYRIKRLEEAYDMGCEEYFYSGYYCFTEWTEKVESLLPDRYLRLKMEEESGRRTLTATVVEN